MPDTSSSLLIVCLCAQWCGTCRDYRPLFDALAAARPGLQWRWLDVEDEADRVGEVDVQTFPTLLIADAAGGLRFAGPVLPRASDTQRLVEAQLDALRAGRAPAALPLPADQVAAFATLATVLLGEVAGARASRAS